jgi:hypothetical protein
MEKKYLNILMLIAIIVCAVYFEYWLLVVSIFWFLGKREGTEYNHEFLINSAFLIAFLFLLFVIIFSIYKIYKIANRK